MFDQLAIDNQIKPLNSKWIILIISSASKTNRRIGRNNPFHQSKMQEICMIVRLIASAIFFHMEFFHTKNISDPSAAFLDF